jgi:hypothetical protein
MLGCSPLPLPLPPSALCTALANTFSKWQQHSYVFNRSLPSGVQIIYDYFSHTIFSCGVNELIDCEVVDFLSVQVKDIYRTIINLIMFYTIRSSDCWDVSWFNREDTLSLTMTLQWLHTCSNISYKYFKT